MGAQENKDIVRQFVSGMSGEGGEGNPLELLSSDVRIHLTGTHKFAGAYNGVQDLTERFITRIMSELDPPARSSLTNSSLRATTLLRSFTQRVALPRPANPYNNQYLCLFKVKDPKITEMEEYADTELVTAAFGPQVTALSATPGAV